MFIRPRSYKRKNGEAGRSFALVESYRKDGTTKHRTLLNLGQSFKIPQAQWGELTQCVAARLKGEACLPFREEDEAFRKAVDEIVQRLLEEGYDIHRKSKQRHFINPEQTTHPDSRTVGGERLILQTLEQLGLAQILRALNFPEKQVKLTFALIVARMLCPGSERKTHQWLRETSSVLQLLDLKLPNLNTLYRCTDLIHQHMDQILEWLFGITQALLGFDETIVFYDLTNTYYHGKKKGDLLAHGRSKEKRNDCPLVTLALTLDASGFPRKVRILPGNAGEPATLQAALAQLRGLKPLVIMDAGIGTQENLRYLNAQGFDWLTVARTQAPPVPEQAPEAQFKTKGGVTVKAWALPEKADAEAPDAVENAGETPDTGTSSPGETANAATDANEDAEDLLHELRAYVHSAAKQSTEDAILESKCEKYLEALAKLHAGLSKRGYLKNYEKVLVKVGRLREEYKQVAHLFEVKVTRKKKGPHAASVTVVRLDSHERRTRASGGYVLRTSRTDLPLEELARTYWRLTEIESTFRVMKSDLGLRPLYHSRDDRIEAHLFITVMAYHAAHFVRTRLKQHGIHDSWASIRETLNNIRRITTRMVKNPYRYLITEVDQDLPPKAGELFACLGFVYDPDITRTVTEHVDAADLSKDKKPPDS